MSYKALLEAGEPVYQKTERFYHYKNPITSERYFSNYLSYYRMPTVADLKEDLAYLSTEQADYDSDYAFVFFAENQELTPELQVFLEAKGFAFEKHLIFTSTRDHLNLTWRHTEPIRIEPLSKETFSAYLAYKYERYLDYGQTYANQMQAYNENHLLTEGSAIYLALDQDNIVGDITAWECGDYIEMDDFYVRETYRGRGIGTNLQYRASQDYQKVILISEEENRAMYEHQGYQEVAYYWTALRSPR
ncbi:UNVERIFIED_CONTAM: GNAT family N-acetyltransferase [Streptococcus canis]|uniref:GNAT family N-acetyltransferase n=1 Tax=Streptococcus canis TaxID=1329 RepID=UPI000B8B6846|nr:GNAT family N-acetyltransferase [Streptococcus canis]QJD12235.1 GNAT family N-acetyltransferase [Streptococcus canis]GFG47124.1 N-acetyltransferase [Streptococcus canis]GMX35406.1 GNAT family N-acetyltransferase [Streptococcus canis]GMX40586.1 GNAT family N-acetyltransferase [Streptococcus canis]